MNTRAVDDVATRIEPAPRRRRRAALLATTIVAVAGLALGSAVVGPAYAASTSVSTAKPGGGGGGNGGGKPGGGGTAELEYAAIGDSFAAGTGAGSYLDGGPCYRSSKSYPKLLDADANRRLVSFPACSGASTVEALSQVATISTTAKLVTITVGGNDVGFADVMSNCIFPQTSSCQSKIDTAVAIAASQQFRDSVASVITAIRDRTEPDAKVIVAGYPLLFHENSSGVNTTYSWADEINDETAVLNGVIQSVAEAKGAVFVDVMDDFAGHGVGSSSPWINDVRLFRSYESFHPNATGQAAYANAIRAIPVP